MSNPTWWEDDKPVQAGAPASGNQGNWWDSDSVAPPTNTAIEIAKHGGSGVAKGVLGTIDMANAATHYLPFRTVLRALTPQISALTDNAKLVEAAKPYLADPPTTTAGRYADKIGEVAGGSMLPLAGVYGTAARVAAAAPATTWFGRAFQGGAQQIVANPGRAAALDAASILGSGAAMQATADGGYGPVVQTIAGIAGGLSPGVVAAYRQAARSPTTAAPIGGEQAQSLARNRAVSTVDDLAAFEQLGVRPFGPAFHQGPIGSVAKQLTETPFIGAQLRNNLDETIGDTANAARRIADDISPTATATTAGLNVQSGLDRFRNAGIRDLDADQFRALSMQPERTVPNPAQISTGAAKDYRQALQIRQELGIDNPNSPMQPTITRPTQVADLTPDELSKIIQAPTSLTSFGAKQEALYARADNLLPDLMKANGARNPNLLAAANTRSIVQQIDGQIANQISGQRVIKGPLLERLSSAQASNFGLDDLRSIRTEIGRSMRGMETETTLNRGQLKQLYGAISRDIEIGIETLANRAAIRVQQARNPAERAAATIEAAAAAKVLKATQQADRFTRLGHERMDRFLKVLNADHPEAAAQRLINASLAGTKGDSQMMRSVMQALTRPERAEFGSLVLREMGRPINSARGIVQDVAFSPTSFVTRYRAMAPEARNQLFTPHHQREIDRLFQVASRIADVEALANTSRSGTNTLNIAGGAGAIAQVAAGNVLTPIAVGVGGFGIATLMSSPVYTRWLSQYILLRAAVRDGTDRAVAPLARHVAGLERMARLNPELWPIYYALSDEQKVDR